jgi:hypothetical protein
MAAPAQKRFIQVIGEVVDDRKESTSKRGKMSSFTYDF